MLAIDLDGRAVRLVTRANGRATRDPSRVLGVRLPLADDLALGALAAATGRSKAEIARSILSDALHRMEPA